MRWIWRVTVAFMDAQPLGPAYVEASSLEEAVAKVTAYFARDKGEVIGVERITGYWVR